MCAQGKYTEARILLTDAASAYEAARLGITDRGLDRAIFGAIQSPYPLLAASHIHLHASSAALMAAEYDLGRGLSDETTFNRGVTLTLDERKQQTSLSNRLNQIHQSILRLVTKSTNVNSDEAELTKLKEERRSLETQLSDIVVGLSQREVATLPQIQASIPADAAVVLWVDESRLDDEHWGCVLRRTGEPVWERLPGTGANKKWTHEDNDLPVKIRKSLTSGTTSPVDLSILLKRLHTQRIAPLVRHLAGVKTLYVIAVKEMAGIPIETLTTNEYTTSYIPSGTFLARIKDKALPTGSALLVLGDPVYSRPNIKPQTITALPMSGLLILQVTPDSTASKAGLQAGDVLMRYGDTELTTVENLTSATQAQAMAKEISITIWREGVEKPITRTVPPGHLSVVISKETAPKAITNRRKTDELLFSIRGGDWKDLPGTRIEVTQIAKLFGPTTTTLLDSAASEQSLDALRRKGELSKFRYLHFATHGETNNVRTLESVLILAQDALPENPMPRVGEPFINGQLSAREVLEFWDLNAELVTLSACETALGRKGGGDGLVGFAQAFLTRGSRAVCLSLWKVDDTATALLMIRFYQNLLGKRHGITSPMPKAQALAEAKRWLRDLSADEALKLTAAVTNGVVRGTRSKDEDLRLLVPSADPKMSATKDSKPFAHPCYWAAFILIGDPN